MATVNLDKSEYDTLVAAVDVARRETVAVKVELDLERSRTTDERLQAALQYVEASKTVIDYAVGNLSPEFTRNWPADAMGVLADQVVRVGPVTQRDRERAEIWALFCRDIEKYERERKAVVTLSDADLEDPAVQKMRDDIARGIAGGILVKEPVPTKIAWKDVALVLTLCAAVFLLIKLFFAP